MSSLSMAYTLGSGILVILVSSGGRSEHNWCLVMFSASSFMSVCSGGSFSKESKVCWQCAPNLEKLYWIACSRREASCQFLWWRLCAIPGQDESRHTFHLVMVAGYEESKNHVLIWRSTRRHKKILVIEKRSSFDRTLDISTWKRSKGPRSLVLQLWLCRIYFVRTFPINWHQTLVGKFHFKLSYLSFAKGLTALSRNQAVLRPLLPSCLDIHHN